MISISKQTNAEKDEYLLDCFHDNWAINELIRNNFSIITWRKWAWKTAIAKYIENKPDIFWIDKAYRISIRDISSSYWEDIKDRTNGIVLFLIIKIVQKLLEDDVFSKEAKFFWNDYLKQQWLQNISEYEEFIETRKNFWSRIKASLWLGTFFGNAEAGWEAEKGSELTKSNISNSPNWLVKALADSLPQNKKIFVFVDDISDYLDNVEKKRLKEDIAMIEKILLKFEWYNEEFKNRVRIISLLRDDIFDFMEGSNVNKLISDSLKIEWNEKSFASLLVRRLPYYQDKLEDYLKDPVWAIKEQFPDDIFTEINKNFSVNQYSCKFYAYMSAISFNRPRDFLQFCYAMRERLSLKHPATLVNIDSTETEYADYFWKELQDEIYLISRILNFESKREKLLFLLSKSDHFGSSQLKTDLWEFLDVKTSIGGRKIDNFISNLWLYWIIWFKDSKGVLINYSYIPNRIPLNIDNIKNYTFYLHRWLWWFLKKRIEFNKKNN